MITKHLPTLLAAALVCITTSHGQSILLAGFDGNQTRIGGVTSAAGVLKGVENQVQDPSAVGKVLARFSTTEAIGKEFQWAAGNVGGGSTWGTTAFTPAADTSNGNNVVTVVGATNISFYIENTGTQTITLENLHFDAKRNNATTASTQVTFAYTSGNLAGTSGVQNLVTTTVSTGYEISLGFLTDNTLAPDESATFTVSNNAGAERLLIDNLGIFGTVAFGPANPVDAGTSTVSASPTLVPADGTSTSTITVTLKDAGGVPVAGEGVTLAKTSGPGTPVISPAGAQTTNGLGVATFTVNSNTVGTNGFTATSATDTVVVTQTASVEFQSALVDAASSTVSASPSAVPANDTTTSTITVTLKNSSGLPLPGKVVSLSGNGAPRSDGKQYEQWQRGGDLHGQVRHRRPRDLYRHE